MELPNRIEDHILRMPGPCWVWQGAKNPRGYGNITYEQKSYKAHRFIYEWLVGPIPEGLTLDHLCRNTLCVNPDHLDPCTMAENIRRGSKAQQTHCKHGHEFTPENTIVRTNGTRRCRECNLRHQRASYQRRKARG